MTDEERRWRGRAVDREPIDEERRWRGREVDREPTDGDVILAVADRRGVDPDAVAAALTRIADRVDMDAVSLADTEE